MEFRKSHTQLSKFFLPTFQCVISSAGVEQDGRTAGAVQTCPPIHTQVRVRGLPIGPMATKHLHGKRWNYTRAIVFAEEGP